MCLRFSGVIHVRRCGHLFDMTLFRQTIRDEVYDHIKDVMPAMDYGQVCEEVAPTTGRIHFDCAIHLQSRLRIVKSMEDLKRHLG